jgi:hypothetical protein
MIRQLLTVFCLISGLLLSAQENEWKAVVLDARTGQPIPGAILMKDNQGLSSTDEWGRAWIRQAGSVNELTASALGYEARTFSINRRAGVDTIRLRPKAAALNEVVVTSRAGEQYRPISALDIRMRGVNNSQEVLRMVPGLFIGQHAGGGKAEQIFLRGFDLDHGTDIQIGVDGMPVNMVSHAHGQGYADLHFLIPELIEQINFKKGGYDPAHGNFATTGFVDFRTYTVLPSSLLKAEVGQFNTYRTVGLFDLLGEKGRLQQQSAYLAGEYMYSDGYFDNPQHFNRYNLFGKYHRRLGSRSTLTLSGSYFRSRWDASGQIPDRAVEDGSISFFGAIDPNEGGSTSRANANLQLQTSLPNGDLLRNQVYYADYRFELFSNFTFFKEDPVNGDQIRQREHRHLFGYNGSYHKVSYLGAIQLASELGVQVRMDRTSGSELARTINRSTTSAQLMKGDIAETNLGVYLSETFLFSPKLSLNAGLRYDQFYNRYADALAASTDRAKAGTWSPKLSLSYRSSEQLQWYIAAGKSFHSNDTRVVVPQNGLSVLPASYGADLGVVSKPARNLLLNAALWYLKLDQEFVYVGDEGVIEPGGRTRRFGADLSVRYQPFASLYLDMDINYSYGRAIDEPKGEDYLPLAPVVTSIGGITYKGKSGLSAALRYRYMADRPANEDNSTIAEGYFVTDANLAYTKRKWEVGLAVQNLFNVRWKETQFDTESRLRNEPAPVTEIHFTPGTPFFLKASLTYFF